MNNNFAYKLRGEKGNPQGKNRVFFTCHPDDFDKHLNKICEEILKEQDCAIWYSEDKNYTPSEEEIDDYYIQLSQMNMMVIPVTFSFLKDGNSKAYKYDFEYAIEHNIPLLMIMEESGLETLFEVKCGTIQYLDRKQDRLTQKSYEEKLKDYLNSVLVSDELAEKVRAAFDAYIFLSYRKKDRKQALEVMKEIHSNDFMRDVAIWFDEFLKPGEEFDEAIKEAFEKSSLFSLVVTPNLNENPNYIIEKEYPMAKEKGVKILPIEVLETDRNQLKKIYDGIPDPVSKSDKVELSSSLMNMLKKEAWKENDDPEHLYYIGLAYFYGIDVERNTEKGLELLKKSANCEDGLRENSFPDAIEKLSNIYEEGDGVKLDYSRAVFYMESCIEWIEGNKQYEEIDILTKINKLSLLYKKVGNYEKAIEFGKQVYKKRKEALGESHLNTLGSLNNLAVYYADFGDYKSAIEFGKEAYEKHKEIYGESYTETLTTLSNLAMFYSYLGNYKKAMELGNDEYEKSKEVLGEYSQSTLISLDNLASYYHCMGNYEKAIELGTEAYEKRKEVLGESHPDTLASLNNFALDYSRLFNEEKAIELGTEAYEKRKEVLGESHPDTLISLGNLAIGYYELDNYEKAIELGGEAYEKSKEVLGESHPDTLSLLSNLASFYSCLGNYEKAIELDTEAYEKRKEVLGESHPDTLISFDNLSSYYFDLGNYEKGIELGWEAYEKYKEVLGESHPNTLNCLAGLALCYFDLNNYEKAMELGKKAYEISKETLGMSHFTTISSLDNLARIYWKSGNYIKAIKSKCIEYINLFRLIWKQ